MNCLLHVAYLYEAGAICLLHAFFEDNFKLRKQLQVGLSIIMVLQVWGNQRPRVYKGATKL